MGLTNVGNTLLHALVADGVFYPSGGFRVLPPIAALMRGDRKDRIQNHLYIIGPLHIHFQQDARNRPVYASRDAVKG